MGMRHIGYLTIEDMGTPRLLSLQRRERNRSEEKKRVEKVVKINEQKEKRRDEMR
jgi:hypothetical protein